MAAVVILQLQACGGSDGAAPEGTLKLSITDKMSDDFADVVIAVKEVRVVPSGMENAQDTDSRLPVVVTYTTPVGYPRSGFEVHTKTAW